MLARCTGPDDGLCGIHDSDDELSECEICRQDWTQRSDHACGMAVSLYDEAHNDRQRHSGDPVADVFGIISYQNGALLSVADGVNWGEKSRLAARCAVHDSLGYLQRAVSRASSTQEIVAFILRSFDSAQKLIVAKQATMTTLCTACIFQLDDGRWGLCSVNVGDSLLFIFSPSSGRVREVTGASHGGKRDLREAGGALGPSDGFNPDLSNLTCCFTLLKEGEVVFGTTDGVSDNFDPTVTKERREASAGRVHQLSPVEQNDAVLRRMAQVLNGELPCGQIRHASELITALLQYSVVQTDAKRRCLEAANMARDDPQREQELVTRSHTLPGKLDHAAVAAIDVCLHKIPASVERKQKESVLANEFHHF